MRGLKLLFGSETDPISLLILLFLFLRMDLEDSK